MDRLLFAEQITLDSSGYGTITAVPAGTSWHTTLISISAAGAPKAKLYMSNRPDPSSFLEGTNKGSSNATDTGYMIANGQSITIEWIGGTPGGQARMQITGEGV